MQQTLRILKSIVKLLAGLILIFTLFLTITFFIVSAPPATFEQNDDTVNDVTQLNLISVDGLVRTSSLDTLQKCVGLHEGKISIGGARHSMGGQIGIEKSLHLDMRSFDSILSFSEEKKEITVQTGVTWRQIQEFIDPYDLSVMIMQTYADFTVGGSLSVNVHGRYIGHGPLIHSVKSIRMILSDGRIVTASRTENSELFRAAIGGYGGIGVLVEATLMLADNCKVRRVTEVMPVTDYRDFFFSRIREDSTVVFHNGDIYPDDYTQIRSVSYLKTNDDVTVTDRLIDQDKSYRFERFAMWMVSEFPGGKWLRQNVGDPLHMLLMRLVTETMRLATTQWNLSLRHEKKRHMYYRNILCLWKTSMDSFRRWLQFSGSMMSM